MTSLDRSLSTASRCGHGFRIHLCDGTHVDVHRTSLASDETEGLLEVTHVHKLLELGKGDRTGVALVQLLEAAGEGRAERDTRAQQILGLHVLTQSEQVQHILEELLCSLFGQETLVLGIVVGPHFLDVFVQNFIHIFIKILLFSMHRSRNLSLLNGLGQLFGGNAAATILWRIDLFAEPKSFGVVASHVGSRRNVQVQRVFKFVGWDSQSGWW
mmetsp:Transcript_2802/g.6828  ORF Transcript_2802/g.6828 Transcript_2802/m.6828 type:complete len:214 (+) Transcript_2802:96-737(+)